MPKSRQRRRPQRTASTVRTDPTAVLALHDAKDAASEAALADALRTFAAAVQTGRSFLAEPHVDVRDDHVLAIVLHDGRTLVDSSTHWDAMERARDETLTAAASRWRAIADWSVNPALGWRSSVPQIRRAHAVAGFARVGQIGDLARSYVSAAIANDPSSNAPKRMDLMLRFGSPHASGVVELVATGMPDRMGRDFDAAMTEMSILMGDAPHAYRMDELVTSEDLREIAVSRLEMRHEGIEACAPFEMMRLMARPALAGMSFRLIDADEA